MRQIEFKKFLDEYKNSVYNYTYYILKNREDAEDVTQDVFIRLWHNRGKVNRRKRRAWIMKVTYNRCMDLIRQKKASISYDRIAVPLNIDLLNHDDPSVNPEFQFFQQESRSHISSAINQLPVKMKSIMILHYFQGFKYKEISNILDISESSIKISMHRGRKVLKQILGEHFPEKQMRPSDE